MSSIVDGLGLLERRKRGEGDGTAADGWNHVSKMLCWLLIGDSLGTGEERTSVAKILACLSVLYCRITSKQVSELACVVGHIFLGVELAERHFELFFMRVSREGVRGKYAVNFEFDFKGD